MPITSHQPQSRSTSQPTIFVQMRGTASHHQQIMTHLLTLGTRTSISSLTRHRHMADGAAAYELIQICCTGSPSHHLSILRLQRFHRQPMRKPCKSIVRNPHPNRPCAPIEIVPSVDGRCGRRDRSLRGRRQWSRRWWRREVSGPSRNTSRAIKSERRCAAAFLCQIPCSRSTPSVYGSGNRHLPDSLESSRAAEKASLTSPHPPRQASY